MTKVTEHIGIRSLSSARVDVDIEVGSADGQEALEWVEYLEAAVREAVDEKKETSDE